MPHTRPHPPDTHGLPAHLRPHLATSPDARTARPRPPRPPALVLATLTYPSCALTLARTSPSPCPGSHTLVLATATWWQRHRDNSPTSPSLLPRPLSCNYPFLARPLSRSQQQRGDDDDMTITTARPVLTILPYLSRALALALTGLSHANTMGALV